MLIRLIFILFIVSSFSKARDAKYYKKHFNIDFNNPKVYKNINISFEDRLVYIDNMMFHVVLAKHNYNIIIVCISKKFGKYSVLIGDFITGENSYDLVLSADKIDNIDRFLNFFEIDNPTDNLIKFKNREIKKRENKGLVIIY
ncbi:MAG: hypothetical protein U9Q66_02605 [Patescibacteria group bacterium]|nr:hypothetical protein [Patescibacteria group bacterium]